MSRLNSHAAAALRATAELPYPYVLQVVEGLQYRDGGQGRGGSRLSVARGPRLAQIEKM